MKQPTECVLRVCTGSAAPAECCLSLGDEVIIGTGADANMRLDDRHAERRHARITYDHRGLHLVDLGSRKGVQVNGKRRPSAELSSGDRIRIGSSTLRVILRRAESQRPVWSAPSDPHALERSTSASEALERGPSLFDPDARDDVLRTEPGGPLGSFGGPPPLELQHVWFQVRRDVDWRSLAVVPADQGSATLPVVHAFARMAALNPGARVLVVDATASPGALSHGYLVDDLGAAIRAVPDRKYDVLDASMLGLNDAELAHVYVPQLLDYIATGTGRHNTVLLALGSLLDQATLIPIARAVDNVLITVALGETRLPDLQRVVDIVGRDRVLGSVVLE